MKPEALITGATGFIGSHLVEELLSRNWKIFCLLRPESKPDFINSYPVEQIIAQIDNPIALEEAVTGKDYVFHLAARIRSTSKKNYDRANHLYTQNLVKACIRKNQNLKRFIYVSSIAASGPSSPGVFFDEDKAANPTSEYGRTKLKGEDAVKSIWDKIPCTIIRPPNVYGPRQKETEILIRLIKKRIVPLLKDKGENTSLIYIDDLIKGLLQAALSANTVNQTYYLTDGRGYSWREIILAIKKHVLGDSIYIPLPENAILFAALLVDILKKTKLIKIFFGRRLWEAMVRTTWLFSSQKASHDFGFKAEYSIDEGIRKTVKYYK